MIESDELDVAGASARGRIVASRYRLDRFLGSGGAGSVYAADDLLIAGRSVALKILHPRRTLTSDERFRAEVRLLRRLSHPSIICIYDGDVDEQGTRYYAMELLDAVNLREAIETGRTAGDSSLVSSLLSTVSEALDYAHTKGVLHRDLKPANLLLSPSGDLTIIDFGMGADLETNLHLTTAHEIVGTPEYLAPERFSGSTRDARSDMYSLGLVCVEAYLGRPILPAASLYELGAAHRGGIARKTLAACTGMPPFLYGVLESMLAVDPQERPETFEVVSSMLKAHLQAPSARRASPGPGLRAWTQKMAGIARRSAASVAIVAALSLLICFLLGTSQGTLRTTIDRIYLRFEERISPGKKIPILASMLNIPFLHTPRAFEDVAQSCNVGFAERLLKLGPPAADHRPLSERVHWLLLTGARCAAVLETVITHLAQDPAAARTIRLDEVLREMGSAASIDVLLRNFYRFREPELTAGSTLWKELLQNMYYQVDAFYFLHDTWTLAYKSREEYPELAETMQALFPLYSPEGHKQLATSVVLDKGRLLGWLIELGAPVNYTFARHASPLANALRVGNEATARMLLDRGADMEFAYGGGTPLFCAAMSGRSDLVELLLSLGASTETFGYIVNPIWGALDRESGIPVDVVDMLLAAGAEPDTGFEGNFAICYALARGSMGTARLLLSYGGSDVPCPLFLGPLHKFFALDSPVPRFK